MFITVILDTIYNQRWQLLRITRRNYGKLQKILAFYGQGKTPIFPREFFKTVVNRSVAKKALNKRIWFLMVQNFRDRSCFRVTAIILQGCHATWIWCDTCDFSSNSRKCVNYLLFNSQKSAYRSSDYRGIPRSLKFLNANFRKSLDCLFWIFGFSDLMVILNKISMHNIIKLNKNFAEFPRNDNVFTQENRAF